MAKTVISITEHLIKTSEIIVDGDYDSNIDKLDKDLDEIESDKSLEQYYDYIEPLKRKGYRIVTVHEGSLEGDDNNINGEVSCDDVYEMSDKEYQKNYDNIQH